MKKTIVLVLIINVFLLMTVDVLNEYNSMKIKVQNLESSVRNSLNASIEATLSAEEFFADTSAFLSSSDSTGKIYAWNGDSFTVGNLYLLSAYMDEHGGRIPNQGAYDSYERSIHDVEAFVYNRLFGNVSTRMPSVKFEEFYNEVAKYCTSTLSVRNRTTGGYSSKTFPTLARMGLKLDTYWNDVGVPYSIGNVNQFTSVSAGGRGSSSYYMTPSSLGVTYLDESLLHNVMYCLLDTQVRCNKVSNSEDEDDLKSAEGTLPTQVYASGATGDYAHHRDGAGHTIINDGQVQYFMDTLDVNVTYYVVDWWDNANWQIVSYIEGTPTGVDPTVLPSYLKSLSTDSESASYFVVVAKVDAEITISLPYNSWVLQWNRHRLTDGAPTEFYGVLGIDAGGRLTANDDGLLYKYTTFCAVTD